MEIVMMMLLVFTIVVAFFFGNGVIIVAIFGGDVSEQWSEYWILILIAVVIDLILLYVGAKIINEPLQLARSGLRNRRNAKKNSAELKKILKDEKSDVDRLVELRNKGIDENVTKRTFRFCQLIENIDGKEQLKECLSEVSEKQRVLDEINDIENRMLKIAESCKDAGDIEKCRYYLDILKSKKLASKITSLEDECQEQIFARGRENSAIWSCAKVLLGILFILVVIIAVWYQKDAPYRKLRSMIREQTLTAEMCSWKNMRSEESVYREFESEKGYKLLVSELTRLHRDDDVSKAMWLLCIQPVSIDGVRLCASSSFIEWIVEYAKTNGVRSTDQDGDDDSWYNVTYSVDGYQIIIDSSADKDRAINVQDFVISDGENRTDVYVKNQYQRETIPTIQ